MCYNYDKKKDCCVYVLTKCNKTSGIESVDFFVRRSENREENERPGGQKALYLYPTTNNQILETSDISISVKKSVIM